MIGAGWVKRMIMHTSRQLFMLGIAAAVFFCAHVRADMIDSESLAAWEVCALCHGVDGVSAVAKFPKLAGQKPDYIEYQLRRFRSGQRNNDGGQMQSVSTEVKEADIVAVAQYFFDQPAVETTGIATDTLLRQRSLVGKELYEKGRQGVPACKNCHGDPNSSAPWLNAQHKAYLEKQIRDFSAGRRQSSISPMEKISVNLTNDEIDSISLYLSLRHRERTN